MSDRWRPAELITQWSKHDMMAASQEGDIWDWTVAKELPMPDPRPPLEYLLWLHHRDWATIDGKIDLRKPIPCRPLSRNRPDRLVG
jgi:hypothetical protein